MKCTIYPCTKSGKILKGFCPTVCESPQAYRDTVLAWMQNAERFGIKYYFDGDNVRPLI